MTTARLTSWGSYPYAPQTPHDCHWRAELGATLAATAQAHGSTLAYGNGRSYGDSCLAHSDHVLHMATLNRFMAFDSERGILQAEAGVTLADILRVAMPRGWFLPVTPGTQFATLGGAIANDVHGKNHHRRGSFGRHLRRLSLLRSDQSTPLLCSSQENHALFTATIGGLGLTGVIAWAELQLIPIRSAQIDSTVVRFNNLREFFQLSAELDPIHEYSVAWVDCLARGPQAGRGVFMVGDHAEYGETLAQTRRKLSIPITPPLSLVNTLSLRAFNQAYWHMHPAQRRRQRQGHEAFFYPLDRILFWNRIYGRPGFQQYQCVIPHANAEAAVAALLAAIAQHGQGSFLAVLKRCGDLPAPGLLSFPLPGTSLALDFPQQKMLAQQLFPRLDAIVREAGGRLYPAKDAHMSGADFRHAYPAWEQLEALRDPNLNSRFWARVMI